MRIRYTPRALDDITAILIYLKHHSPQGTRNVARAMRKTIDLIGQFPQSGRPVSEFGVRALPVGHILIWSTGVPKWMTFGSFTFGIRPAVLGIRTLIGLSRRLA